MKMCEKADSRKQTVENLNANMKDLAVGTWGLWAGFRCALNDNLRIKTKELYQLI